jgi:ketosteroid isomerase-like protein
MDIAEPAHIVETYLKAFEHGDFDRVRSCLSDAFSYTGPTARFNNPESFIENIWHVGQIIHHIEIRKTFVEDNDVCTFMNFHVHLDERRSVPVVQWAKVEDGKIRTIEVFFDASDYTAMFASTD